MSFFVGEVDLPHYINPTVITRVQFQHHLPHILHAVDTSCQREDCACFAGAWRAVQEKMWEALSCRVRLRDR